MDYIALLLEKEGRIFEESLLSALKQSDVLRGCYAYKSRVKTDEKLIEKVKIRKEDGYSDYSIGDITDVIGLRLITLFRVDMVDVLEKVINIINHNYELTPNPFKKGSIEELIFYTNRTNDNINFLLKDVVVKLEIEEKYEVKQRGSEYSSIHIVARVNKKITKLSEGESSYYLPVEIQIRTVFEDAWGEVDHKYGYSIKKGKKTEHKIRNPKNILRHLDTLKKFSDACGEYADAIHLGILQDSSEESGLVTIFSVESDQETIDLFRKVNVPDEDIGKYLEARKLREDGISKKKTNIENAAAILLSASNIFKNLSDKCFVDGEITQNIFHYYTSMNYAFCLLSTNIKKEVEECLPIYEDLEAKYPDYLLVKMRLAQAYGQNSLIDLSLKKCEEAYSIFSQIKLRGYTPSIELPDADYNHIKKYLPKVYGYYLWIKSDKVQIHDHFSALKKSKILTKAYFLTKESLDEDAESVSLYNNLLYYAMEIANISKEYSKVNARKEIVNSVEINLKNILERVNVESNTDINTLDTISKAYNYLGDDVERDKIINRLIPLAEESLATHGCDNEIIEAIIREAKELRGEAI